MLLSIFSKFNIVLNIKSNNKKYNLFQNNVKVSGGVGDGGGGDGKQVQFLATLGGSAELGLAKL